MASRWLRSRTRRVLDVVTAVALLVLTAPVTLVLAGLVRAKMGRPVFFLHERAGRDGTTFKMVKFRSMTSDRDAHGRVVEEADRITGIGRWMRATSLDEVPELLNVIRGEMSLIGPRPLLVEYTTLYDQEQAVRLLVRPGLTGLAQVSGRNALTWQEKFRLDVEYVRTASPRTDLSILVRTVTQVLHRSGIAAEGHTSSPKFTGGSGAGELAE